MKTDTIAAIATGMTNSGIGIVRISGEDAFSAADRIFVPYKGNKKVSEMDSHTIHYGTIRDEDTLVDEVLLLVMKAPHSYTTEDTVEIDCHGGTLVMQKILKAVIKNGARPAEPGEFTKRAFLNGRIDLSQAESVADVISAKNEFALKSSINQLRGSVSEKIKKMRAVILQEIAFIESALDDPEHIDINGYPQKLQPIVEELCEDINKLLKTADDGRILKEGIRTVIVGKPNAGKSSLLNILVGQERAIVTEIAGTTRDTLEEQIQLGGISLNVMDTAGIRDTADPIEKIGVQRSIASMEQADLIIYVADSSTLLDENDNQIIQAVKNKKAIVLLNKSDLKTVTSKNELEQRTGKDVIEISAKEHTGIDQLEKEITNMFFSGEISFNDEVYITNIRQQHSLEEAKKSLEMVCESIQNQMPEDFYSIDLMDAYEQLGFIIGESVEDDLMDEIFSKFCMGK